MPAGVSAIADHIAVAGLLLSVSATDTSPYTFSPVCNIKDVAVPIAATEVLVTNVSDTWVRRVPTLLDMGKVTFSIFWVMTEPSHMNVASGLRYLLMNRQRRMWQVSYPDGASPTNSIDQFEGYVTSFQISGKVGDVFNATCGIGTTGTPTLV